MYQENSADRAARDMHNDAAICTLVSNALQCVASGTDLLITDFAVHGKKFNVFYLDRNVLDSTMDHNDVSALNNHYTYLNTFAAVGKQDNKAYTIWEFYSEEGSDRYLGKGIETDVNHHKQGIATGMMAAVKAAGFDIKPSGTQTRAGAALLNAVEALAPSTDADQPQS